MPCVQSALVCFAPQPSAAPTLPPQAVDKAKQLKAQVGALEAQLADATKHKEELARLQQQLGQLHAANSALKDQARAARQRRADAVAAREGIMNAQVGLACAIGTEVMKCAALCNCSKPKPVCPSGVDGMEGREEHPASLHAHAVVQVAQLERALQERDAQLEQVWAQGCGVWPC